MPSPASLIRRSVINGASDLFIEFFGEAGRHVRAATRRFRSASQCASRAANVRRTGGLITRWPSTLFPPFLRTRAGTARLKPRLNIAPGDTVHLECADASGAQVHPAMTLAEFLAIDRHRIHALTGPIFVDGAEPGDVLQIEVLEVAHKGWGWSSVIAGLGFLKERFYEPYPLSLEARGRLQPVARPGHRAVAAILRRDGSRARRRRRVPHSAAGAFRRQYGRSAALRGRHVISCPFYNSGALFSAGDAHAAQGDGEVCINGIECPADVTLRFRLHKQQRLAAPIVESACSARQRDVDSGRLDRGRVGHGRGSPLLARPPRA